MKAVVFYGRNDVRVEERQRPEAGAGEVVVRVAACAVCGTDIRIIRNGHRTVRPPAVIGHEIAGVVDEIGEGVGCVAPGDRVVIVTPVGCGRCKLCREGFQNMCDLVSRETHSIGYYCDGGFAEYVKIPREAVENGNLLRFEPVAGVSFEEMSLVEPLSCVINGQRFLNIAPGESVAIFGGGAIGCMHALLARDKGAGRIFIIDNNGRRVEMVKKLAIADKVIDSSTIDAGVELMRLTGGRGVENVIVACSSPEAQKKAFEVSGIRSRISLFAGVPAEKRMLEIDVNDIHYLEKSVFGAFASAHHQYREAIDLIASGKISLRPLISEVLPLDEFERGVEMLADRSVFKVVISPWKGGNA